MKVLQVEQKGFVWYVPCSVIAKDRAEYYADKGDDYNDEYEYTMSSEFELSDWFFNNMNWEDLHGEAKLVDKPKEPTEIDFAENMQSEFIEVSDD